MEKRLTKSEAKSWLELIREFLESGGCLPEFDSSRGLLELDEFLLDEIKELAEKLEKALMPMPGQRLRPEQVLIEATAVLWQVANLLKFSSRVIFDQHHKLASLRDTPVAQQAPPPLSPSKTASQPKQKASRAR